MKPLKFGLLGAGYFGRHYIRLLKKSKHAELKTVAVKNKKALNKLELDESVTKTTDPFSVISDPQIDCLIIATPPSTHFSFANAALKYKKHVLVEKPMVKSIKEAQKLRQLVKKSRTTFMVGHQYVYNDYIDYLRLQIRKGSFGKIQHVLAEHLYPGPIRNDIGCLWEAGTHQLSVLEHLFNPGKLEEVKGKMLFRKKDKNEYFICANLRFSSGLAATLVVSWFYPQKIRKLTLVGEKVTSVFDDIQEKEKLKLFEMKYPNSVRDFSVFLDPKKYKLPKINAREPLQNELDHFIKCIRIGQTPRTGIDNSCLITEWLAKISKDVK